MTPQELLNTDMASLGRWLRQGLAWWGAELAELVPPALRRRPGRGARRLARMQEDGAIQLWRDGVLQEVALAPQATLRPADLLLPPGAALVQELELPRVSGADLRRLLDLNIDRYTPLRAEQVYFDAVPLGRTGEGARQRVKLGVISRPRARAALEHAGALGVKAERLAIGAGPDGRTPEFDFLRVIRAEEGGDPAGRRRAWLWGACAVFLLVNVAVAVGRDMIATERLRRVVEAQQPTLDLALRLRRSVAAERARRVALLTRRSAHEPLRIVDAVTRALPPGQWVQRLEWNGRAVRLVGTKQPGFDLVSALRGPALAAPRSLLADMPTHTATGEEPFDVTAEAVAARPAAR